MFPCIMGDRRPRTIGMRSLFPLEPIDAVASPLAAARAVSRHVLDLPPSRGKLGWPVNGQDDTSSMHGSVGSFLHENRRGGFWHGCRRLGRLFRRHPFDLVDHSTLSSEDIIQKRKCEHVKRKEGGKNMGNMKGARI